MSAPVIPSTTGILLHGFLSFTLFTVCACGSSEQRGNPADSDSSTDGEIDTPGEDFTEAIDPPIVCGNGIVEDDEECDDGNRINGDGCDWLCREGDGPPDDPIPDPDTPGLSMDGDPALLRTGESVRNTQGGFDFEWNGTQYSLVYLFRGSDSIQQTKYIRLDESGIELWSEWDFSLDLRDPDAVPIGIDHLWNGSEYGLFYAHHLIDGIWFVRIGDTGKRLSDPVPVVIDDDANFPAAAWSGEQYGLSWMRWARGSSGGCGELGHAILYKPVEERGGIVDDSEILLDSDGGWMPYIEHTSDGSFRIAASTVGEFTDEGLCNTPVIERSVNAAGLTWSSTILGHGDQAGISKNEDEYAIVFLHRGIPSRETGTEGLYFARFNLSGELLEPPYRFAPLPERSVLGLRIASDEYGYAVIWNNDLDTGDRGGPGLYLARMDYRGRVVGEVVEVREGGDSFAGVSQFDIAGSTHAYAVAYSQEDSIYFQLLH